MLSVIMLNFVMLSVFVLGVENGQDRVATARRMWLSEIHNCFNYFLSIFVRSFFGCMGKVFT
jgi:hypothetical protein